MYNYAIFLAKGISTDRDYELSKRLSFKSPIIDWAVISFLLILALQKPRMLWGQLFEKDEE
jgi:hypothetical protein